MSLSSSSHSGSRDRTTSSRSFAPPERLSLSVQEAIGVEELALAVVGETLEAYEAHRTVDKRHVLSEKWKEVRRHENIIVYKERQGWRPPFQTLRTMDGRLMPVMCKNAPTLLALGTLQGSLDDEMYGCFIDTDEAATTRSAYLGDGIEQLRWLAEIRGPSKEDPFRFCGVCWCALGSPYPLVKKRDYCIAVASGMTRTQHGERVGYYAIHSVDLWSPRDGEHTFVRSKGSLCWLKTELRTGKVDLFVKGFFAPMGNVPEFAGQASLISAMLATAQTSDASYSKKLEWMIRDAAAASSPNQPLPPMYECVGRCKTAFGIAKSSGFKRCIVCKMPICSTCEIVRKIAVDVSNGHVLKNRCSICLHCMNHAKNANAATYAVRDTQMSNSRRWKSVDAHSTSTLLLSEDTGIQYADDVPTAKPYY